MTKPEVTKEKIQAWVREEVSLKFPYYSIDYLLRIFPKLIRKLIEATGEDRRDAPGEGEVNEVVSDGRSYFPRPSVTMREVERVVGLIKYRHWEGNCLSEWLTEAGVEVEA